MSKSVYLPSDVVAPQHLQCTVGHPTDPAPHLLTVYTGYLRVEVVRHIDEIVAWDFLFPLVGLVPGPTMAVYELADNTFKSAVASVAVADAVDLTDPCVASVMEAHADLRTVTLNGLKGRPINAVTLRAKLHMQNCELHSLVYNVSVLSLRDPAPGFIEIKSPEWDGTYAGVSKQFIPGVPQT